MAYSPGIPPDGPAGVPSALPPEGPSRIPCAMGSGDPFPICSRTVPQPRTPAVQDVPDVACTGIGTLSPRELFLVGVGLYWSEGAKAKPGSHRRVIFVNSDPDMIRLFLRWLDLLGVEPHRRRFSVNIHESADVPAAEAFWAAQVGIGVGDLLKTSLKRHNPRTRRTNTGAGYHGCLRVAVLRSAELHRRIECWWRGMVGGADGRLR
ncbi:hypothetical protein GCM10010499_46230 [Streptomyces thermoviolaceus subsp. apingens]|nr:hypothetical protein GCM10010499_46230 [Streptomyces thermoviolaceus subsp. apingens]